MLAMSATTIPLGRVPLLQAVDADSSEPGRIRSTELAPTAPPVCLPNRKGVLFIVRLLELRAIMRFIAKENQQALVIHTAKGFRNMVNNLVCSIIR